MNVLDRSNITTDPTHPGARLVGRTLEHAPTASSGIIVGTCSVPFNTPQGDLPRVWVIWSSCMAKLPYPETIKSIERFLV